MPVVQAANGNWSELPKLNRRRDEHLSTKAMQRLFEISKERKCRLPGQGYGELNLRLSFAARFKPDGTLTQLVLPKLNCPEAEGILAGVPLDMVKGGDYRPVHPSELGWHRGDMTFGWVAER